jgi:hypothetical protein
MKLPTLLLVAVLTLASIVTTKRGVNCRPFHCDNKKPRAVSRHAYEKRMVRYGGVKGEKDGGVMVDRSVQVVEVGGLR